MHLQAWGDGAWLLQADKEKIEAHGEHDGPTVFFLLFAATLESLRLLIVYVPVSSAANCALLLPYVASYLREMG